MLYNEFSNLDQANLEIHCLWSYDLILFLSTNFVIINNYKNNFVINIIIDIGVHRLMICRWMTYVRWQ